MAFEDGQDARMMRAALKRRLSALGLELHEDKTRILRFGRYARETSSQTLSTPHRRRLVAAATHAAARRIDDGQW
jgi:hypothetical protein